MFEALLKDFSGELYFREKGVDKSVRRVYATDASEYQEMPLAVAIPRSIKDLQELIKVATENNVTLIPRAAGTSLAGQVVGSGLVVDLSVHFNEILELNVEEKWVRVQPGVIRDDLNAYLKPFGLMFGPETSTANRAMIGGMIGNNSCGLHSIIWGNTRDHLLEVKAILHDGKEVQFGKNNREDWNKKSEQEDAEGHIYHALGTLLGDTENRKNIAEGFPRKDIKRRNTGYALDILSNALEAKQDLNICQLIAGAEGTLCIITEAKLNLMHLPPAQVAMIAIHTQTIQEAMYANLVALEQGCAASELVDDFILPEDIIPPSVIQQRNAAMEAALALDDLNLAAAAGDIDAFNEANDAINEGLAESIEPPEIDYASLLSPEEEDELGALDFVGLTDDFGETDAAADIIDPLPELLHNILLYHTKLGGIFVRFQ